jgi:hypothetical protein
MQAPDPIVGANGTSSGQKQSKRTYKKGTGKKNAGPASSRANSQAPG